MSRLYRCLCLDSIEQELRQSLSRLLPIFFSLLALVSCALQSKSSVSEESYWLAQEQVQTDLAQHIRNDKFELCEEVALKIELDSMGFAKMNVRRRRLKSQSLETSQAEVKQVSKESKQEHKALSKKQKGKLSPTLGQNLGRVLYLFIILSLLIYILRSKQQR